MSFDAALVVRSRTTAVIALASLAIALLSIIPYALGVESAMVGFYALYGVLIGLPMHVGWMGAKKRPARITVDEHAVRVDGISLRRRARLASAKILPQPKSGAIVELRNHFDVYPARIDFQTEADARAFV